MEELKFPELPKFSKAKIDACRSSKDFRPIFFEIYKHIGIVCSMISCISKNSPAIKSISNLQYGILTGLMNRCSRLMLANAVLSSKGKFGETTAIIDRCILESSINIMWLCKYEKEKSFERFIINGLKGDLELQNIIKQKIYNRNSKILEIEKRMIDSIDECIKLSEINREDIDNYQRFPNFETRIKQLDFVSDELSYTIIQRMGSHHIHGTWTSLLTHYIYKENGEFYPKDNNVSIHVNQFISVSLEILEMLKYFINFIIIEESITAQYLSQLDRIREYLDSYRLEILGSDFNETKA